MKQRSTLVGALVAVFCLAFFVPVSGRRFALDKRDDGVSQRFYRSGHVRLYEREPVPGRNFACSRGHEKMERVDRFIGLVG